MPPKPMTFTNEARAAASAWKQQTDTLPQDARADGPYRGVEPTYPFCLPSDYRAYNLLPDARSAGISRFAAAGIPWHKGRASLPSTHLLSSQVQCVNALAPMMRNARSIQGAFGSILDIAEVLPFGDESFDTEDLIAFEWVGLTSHLNEWTGSHPSRGANTTSVDAAIRYRTSTGDVEIALIEWKYTERYAGTALGGGPQKLATRTNRYEALFNAGPVATDVLPLASFFAEPFYQLLRQQLLAREMERKHELGAIVVRVLHAAPARNLQLWASMPAAIAEATQRDDVRTAWAKLLNDDFSDRFVSFDTANLVAEDAPTSVEFRARYGHLAG